MIKTFSYSGWRQYILEIIHMVLDGFHGLPVINLTHCINTLVNFKFIFLKKEKKEMPKLRLRQFLRNSRAHFVKKISCSLSLHIWVCAPPLRSAFPGPLTEKQTLLFTVMSSELQKPPWTFKPPARVKLTPNSTIIHSPSPQKRTLKSFCF